MTRYHQRYTRTYTCAHYTRLLHLIVKNSRAVQGNRILPKGAGVGKMRGFLNTMGWVVVMSVISGGNLGEYFGNLEDPRRDQGKRHQLLDIIAMTICAVIGGAEGWSHVELFVKCKYEWFQRFLDLPNGVPCPDTFARVFARIDPEQFRGCFMEWVSSVNRLTQGQVIALDGKTLRRSHDRNSGKAAIHLVSAWASENSLVLGQTRVDAKSNEITAIPDHGHTGVAQPVGPVRLHRNH